jgi:hypothetical protein
MTLVLSLKIRRASAFDGFGDRLADDVDDG